MTLSAEFDTLEGMNSLFELDDFLLDSKPSDSSEWFTPDRLVEIQARQMAKALGCPPQTLMRLSTLGMSLDDVREYLNPTPKSIQTPEATVPGMKAAAKALLEAIQNQEKVAIYADYDVDGQTSLAIMQSVLSPFDTQVFAASANAVKGFGLDAEFVKEAAEFGAKWLITLDCGSTQTEAIVLARSLGMKTIVVDHHDVDLENPTDFHLNPRIIAGNALKQINEIMLETKCRQRIKVQQPFDLNFKLTNISKDKVSTKIGETEFQRLSDLIDEFAHPNNTGSMLTWKFAASILMEQHGEVPVSHYGRSLYLAGLGAIADLAPCDNLEVRAFTRVPVDEKQADWGNKLSEIAPLGIHFLAHKLEENPMRLDSLIRTRALLNLGKRTTKVNIENIARLLQSEDSRELEIISSEMVKLYEKMSMIRKLQMDPQALMQYGDQDPSDLFAVAVLEDFKDYAGYARMVANTLVKASNKPALCFVYKGTDEWGQKLYKFSAANGVVPSAKLGELIVDSKAQEACSLIGRNWLGAECQTINLGGHSEVASGVVKQENIEAMVLAAENWAKAKQAKNKWKSVTKRKQRLSAVRVSSKELQEIEASAQQLAPISFPKSPPIRVSVVGQIAPPVIDVVKDAHQSIISFDGYAKTIMLSEQAADLVRAEPDCLWEAILTLGLDVNPYVSVLAKA